MCGYCIEEIYFCYRLGLQDAAWDPILLPIHLQETTDWRSALEGSSEDDPLIHLIALGRAWESAITERSTAAVDSLKWKLGMESWLQLQTRIEDSMPDSSWEWVLDGEPPPSGFNIRSTGSWLSYAKNRELGEPLELHDSRMFWTVLGAKVTERLGDHEGLLRDVVALEPANDLMSLWAHRCSARALARHDPSTLGHMWPHIRPANVAAIILSGDLKREDARAWTQITTSRASRAFNDTHWGWKDPFGADLISSLA